MKKSIICALCAISFSSFYSCEKTATVNECSDGRLVTSFTDTLSSYFENLEFVDYYVYSYQWDSVSQWIVNGKIITKYELMDFGYNGYHPSIPLSMYYLNHINLSSGLVSLTEFRLSCDYLSDSSNLALLRNLLSIAIDKHQQRYAYEFSSFNEPLMTRRSGLLLILSILQQLQANTELDEICRYCSTFETVDIFILANNERFNEFIIKTVKKYLNRKD